MLVTNNEQLNEFISNAQIAFFNGQYHEAFNLAQEAIVNGTEIFDTINKKVCQKSPSH